MFGAVSLVGRLQHSEPSVSSCDDGVGVGSADEGLRGLVVLADEAVDGGREVDDGPEDAVFEPPARQDGKEALDRVQPGPRCGCKVEGPVPVAIEPGPHLLLLVDGIVVEDDVGQPAGLDVALDGVEEADELLMPVACMFCPNTTPVRTSSAATRVAVPWRL